MGRGLDGDGAKQLVCAAVIERDGRFLLGKRSPAKRSVRACGTPFVDG